MVAAGLNRNYRAPDKKESRLIMFWFSKIELSSIGKNYYLFKQDLNFENYLINLSMKHYSSLLKFRLSNHRLPVETGRWENISLDERKCNLCPKNDIRDEFHYLFTCDNFHSDRKQFLKSYFYKKPNVMKFKELFSTKDTQTLINLAKYVDIIMKKFLAKN